MAIYDYQGNVISGGSGDITDEQIRNAFLQAVISGSVVVGTSIGDTLPIGTHYFTESYVQDAYTSLLSAYEAHPNSIPFFVHTDQHGRGVEIQRYVNNIDVDMECANINLGDTVVDTYSSGVMENVYQRIKFIKNYIGVPGNHEHKPSSEENPDKYFIRKAFTTTNLERRMITTDTVDCYVAYQPIHGVKFICLDLYDHYDHNGSQPYTTAKTANWIITELSRNDGYDVVLLLHEPIPLTYKYRDDVESYTNTQSATLEQLFYLFLARKNKGTGTYTAADGSTHTYDFSNAKNELLCMLSGHRHEEMYSDADGLTVYVQDWAGNNKYGGSFGLIDRDSNLLRIYRFDNVSGVYQELEISLQMT